MKTKTKLTTMASFLAIIWSLWKDRNTRCLEDVSSSMTSLAEKIKFSIATRISILLRFWDFFVGIIIIHWEEIAFSLGSKTAIFDLPSFIHCPVS